MLQLDFCISGRAEHIQSIVTKSSLDTVSVRFQSHQFVYIYFVNIKQYICCGLESSSTSYVIGFLFMRL